MNPQRRDRILKATGWKELCPGTLNLDVTEDCVHRLLLCTATIRERGEDVKYPEPYADIPKLRVGYLYYSGRIVNGNKTGTVLIRRACNPLKTRLEAFSDVKLRESLEMSDRDAIVCEVDE